MIFIVFYCLVSGTVSGLNHFVNVFHMIGLVDLEDLPGLLETEPSPLPHTLLPQLLGVQTLHVQDEHPGPVTLLGVLEFSEISSKLP